MQSHYFIHIVSIACVIIFILFQCYQNYPFRRVTDIRYYHYLPKFALLTPESSEKLSKELLFFRDDPKQLMDLSNFSYTLNPKICGNDILLLIIVPSKASHFENRNIIRQTWGRVVDSTRIVFLLAFNVDETANITEENSKHHDLVQGSFLDAYRNMTYKHVMGLKWVAANCKAAKYILKADDDVVLNADKLRKFLVRDFSPWGAERLILCYVWESSVVKRKHSKWKVTKKEFNEDHYPKFCSGQVILYSRDVIPRLLSKSYTMPYFFIDDVYVTGILRQQTNIRLTHTFHLYQSGYKDTNFKDTAIFGGYDINNKNMLPIWKRLNRF